MPNYSFFEGFTNPAQLVAEQVYTIASRYRHTLIHTEHILLALLEAPDALLAQVYTRAGVRVDQLKGHVADILRYAPGSGSSGRTDEYYITPGVRAAIEQALRESWRDSAKLASTEHILLGLLYVYSVPDLMDSPVTAKLLIKAGLTLERIRQVVGEIEHSRQSSAGDQAS